MPKIISLILFVSLIAGIRAACMCKEYMGVHCGERKSDAQPTLREEAPGDCNEYIIYQCSAANIPATDKGYCSYCAKGEKPGTDYCAIGRKGEKAETKPCTCGIILGVHCGERYNDGYITGDCDFESIYQCPAANVPAQSKGKCGWCAKGEKAGTDYCAIGRNGKSKLFYK